MSTAHERLLEHARLIATAGRSVEAEHSRHDRGATMVRHDNVVRIAQHPDRPRRRAG